jgi:hypothetical protein
VCVLDVGGVEEGRDGLWCCDRGLALERKGAYAEALDSYENAALANPKEVQPWWLRYALVLYEENQVCAVLA